MIGRIAFNPRGSFDIAEGSEPIHLSLVCFMARRIPDYPDHHLVVRDEEGRVFAFDAMPDAIEWLRVAQGVDCCSSCGWVASSPHILCACGIPNMSEKEESALRTA